MCGGLRVNPSSALSTRLGGRWAAGCRAERFISWAPGAAMIAGAGRITERERKRPRSKALRRGDPYGTTLRRALPLTPSGTTPLRAARVTAAHHAAPHPRRIAQVFSQNGRYRV
jgi:hypothetical protein